jgi:hypothetical protein
MPDERQRGALDAVDKLVGQFDRERDGQGGNRRLSVSIKTHVTHGTANPGSGADRRYHQRRSG